MTRLRTLLGRLWPFGASDHAESETDPAASGDGEADAEGTGSVWDAIPSWQYGGRHAESGGIARGEQERALEGIRRRAEREGEEPEWQE